MALKECKECGNEFSTKARKCPTCGAPIPIQIPGTVLGCCLIPVCVLGALSIVLLFIFVNQMAEEDSRPKTPEEIHKEQIEDQFSAWDGSHQGLTRLIKSTMNDPDSYDHVKTQYLDRGDYLIVKTTFRGKNVFGGVVTNWMRAKVDFDGNVLEVIDQGP